MPGRPPAVSDFDVLRAVVDARRESGDPAVTTQEVAARLPIKREGLGRRLNDLAAVQLVHRKQVGASYIWWVPDDVRPVVQPDASTGTETDSGDAVTADSSVADRLQPLFEIGRERFGLELGALARVNPDADWFQIEHTSHTHSEFTPGTEFALSETYCTAPTEAGGPVAVTDPENEGFHDRAVCAEIGFQTYLGTLVDLDTQTHRTFFFVSSTSRTEQFSDADLALQNLLGQCVKHLFE